MANPLFKTRSVKIETLAGYLRQIREQLNLDVKTVSMLTQIKPQYLEALEAGNWENLPADVYIRGFLKSLAQVYRVKEQVLLDQYDKEHGFAQVKKPQAKNRGWSITFTPKTIIIALTVIVTLAVVGYVVTQVSSVLTPPALDVSEPAADQAIVGNSLIVAGRAEVGADVFVNDQAVMTDKNGEFNENLVLSQGLNVIEIVARNKFKKESRVTRKISADIPEQTPAEENSPVNLVLEVGPNSAWIYLVADGAVVQNGTMLAGSSKTVSAKQDIILTTANAGSTKVNYNGKDLGTLGRENEVLRNVEFSAQKN
ncbi:MAG: RodZ domain-containing protein [Acidobacteriaceae bacterium]